MKLRQIARICSAAFALALPLAAQMGFGTAGADAQRDLAAGGGKWCDL